MPDLAATPSATVIIHEGEKCADIGRDELADLCHTSAMGGAEGAKHADYRPIKGRDVIIFPDGNKAGERYRDEVATGCWAAGARSVRVVEVPDGVPGDWDFAWALEDGWSVDSLAGLIAKAKPWIDPSWPEPDPLGLADQERPFPIDALPAVIGNAVRCYRDFGQQPLAMVAFSAWLCARSRVRGWRTCAAHQGLKGQFLSLF